jgi:hypothetical protein
MKALSTFGLIFMFWTVVAGQTRDSLMMGSKQYPQSKDKEYAATRFFPLEMGEYYVLKVKVQKPVISNTYTCGLIKFNATLFNVKVEKVFYCEEAMPFNQSTISNLKFIVVPSEHLDNFRIDQDYYIAAMPARSKSYLRLSRILDKNPSGYEFHQSVVFTNPPRCEGENTDAFDRFIAYERE